MSDEETYESVMVIQKEIIRCPKFGGGCEELRNIQVKEIVMLSDQVNVGNAGGC